VIKVHATNAVAVKSWVFNTDDGEKAVISTEIDFLKDVYDIEDRFAIFRQSDSSDRNITFQIFAFKFNNCKLREGLALRENSLLQMLKKGAKELDDKCPLRKGLKMYAYNQTFDDTFLPPISIEIQARSHKEVFVKFKGSTKWTKYFTEDVFMRVKK
jgi:hypothetical protein